ncbi:MAG: LysR family transcriptional regulator [Hyphomicrobiaceae bacterium]
MGGRRGADIGRANGCALQQRRHGPVAAEIGRLAPQLNVSAASISMKMSALEARIGARLCQRGRIGFRLTGEGEQVYSAARQLFEAHTSFLAEIGNLKGHLVGKITIAMIDATVTNRAFKLQDAIRAFIGLHPNVHLTLLVLEPSAIERQLLSADVQVGIAPFYHHVPNIAYEPLFEEPHSLYCGKAHKLFSRAPDKLKRGDLNGVSYVTRGYLPAATSLYRKERPSGATVFDMEAMVHLIQSGMFIGYVPDHFAKSLIASGELRPIRPDLFRHVSRFDVATRKGGNAQRIVDAFMVELRAAQSRT